MYQLIILVIFLNLNFIETEFSPPLFSPCQFPVPNDINMYRHYCRPYKGLKYICDIHRQLEFYNVDKIIKTYKKHEIVFNDNGEDLIGVVIVKQLNQPNSLSLITPSNNDYGCLFTTPCFNLSPHQLEKFIENFKFFTKGYTAILHRRWFEKKNCSGPRILVLVLTDGILSDNRKLSTVVIETDETRLKSFVSNIQIEINNLILQGESMNNVISELLDQIGYALREYHVTGGIPRKHSIPSWAFQLTFVSVFLVVVAMIIEWCIVRRKLLVNRSQSGMPAAAGRSKTHLIF